MAWSPINEEMAMRDTNKTYHHCPTHGGGRNWPFSAFSPSSKTLYVQLQNMCADTKVRLQTGFTPAMQYNTVGKFVFSDGKIDIGRH